MNSLLLSLSLVLALALWSSSDIIIIFMRANEANEIKDEKKRKCGGGQLALIR